VRIARSEQHRVEADPPYKVVRASTRLVRRKAMHARPERDRILNGQPIRDDLKQRGIRAVIPPKSNPTRTICYSKRLYRQRNCIELGAA
jgi:hypothetical protein